MPSKHNMFDLFQVDMVYQRSQLRPAYKKCVVHKFENGSLIVFFRLYLDRRKIPRQEVVYDALIYELLTELSAVYS